jgi:hypothetical protein
MYPIGQPLRRLPIYSTYVHTKQQTYCNTSGESKIRNKKIKTKKKLEIFGKTAVNYHTACEMAV